MPASLINHAHRSAATPDWAWVDAAPFRAHVRHVLTIHPLPWRVLAGYARVPDSLVRALLGIDRRPLRRIPPHYARALLAVDAGRLATDLNAWVETGQAAVAARTLQAAGWSVARIAHEGGFSPQAATTLLQGQAHFVTRHHMLALHAATRAHGLEPTDTTSATDQLAA